jgi:hypothetical protein
MPDPEIDAMVAVSEAFEVLDGAQQARVLRWAGERYGAGPPRDRADESHDGSFSEGTEESETVESPTPPPDAEFGHFAELYDAVSPSTRLAKALVAAYWLQELKGAASWGSGQVNRELKDLGHQLTEINKVLQLGIDKRPAVVLQLKKSGSTKQGRKTYKLSAAGVKEVKDMLRKARE